MFLNFQIESMKERFILQGIIRLVLGNGDGKNWWCVMFPPLCIVNTQEETENVEYRSAFLDWLNEYIFGDLFIDSK